MSGVGKVRDLLSRLGPRREAEAESVPPPAPPETVVATKALRKLTAALRQCQSPTLIDLGPVIGSNVQFFGEQLGCKMFIADLVSEVDRCGRAGGSADLQAVLDARLPREPASVDGVLCWDTFDFLDRGSARVVADRLMRLLATNGVLFGFFATEAPVDSRLSKFIVVDEATLWHRWYSTPRMRQSAMQNRDIITLFERLRVSDSFLLHTKVREILFRKPDYLPNA